MNLNLIIVINQDKLKLNLNSNIYHQTNLPSNIQNVLQLRREFFSIHRRVSIGLEENDGFECLQLIKHPVKL